MTEAASRVSVRSRRAGVDGSKTAGMGKNGGVVMEGRDIGTKVFPHADLKVFLDADPVVPEQRRLRIKTRSRACQQSRWPRNCGN